MVNSKIFKTILTVLIFTNMIASASSFKGYKRTPAQGTLRYTETVERFKETEHDFLILISRHAAFYRFPKNVDYADQIRSFLNNRMKSKKQIILEVDPTTTEILNISDTN